MVKKLDAVFDRIPWTILIYAGFFIAASRQEPRLASIVYGFLLGGVMQTLFNIENAVCEIRDRLK